MPTSIESIGAGDSVYAYDEKTSQVVVARVRKSIKHAASTYGRLKLSDGTTIGGSAETASIRAVRGRRLENWP